MGTSASIFFNCENSPHMIDSAGIYLHYDGYPDGEHGVINKLVKILKVFDHERGVGDTVYLLARAVQYFANGIDGMLGIGVIVANPADSDTSYTYIVTPEKIYCRKQNTLEKIEYPWKNT